MTTETLAGLMAAARKQLSEAGIETASLDVRLLLQAATGFAHEDLIVMPNTAIEPRAAVLFKAYIARRLNHEPVSRILGTREFYGRPFAVSPAVLDPRPDTEVVVELALKHMRAGRFIDLGTGSGAIAITLCAENPHLEGIATDVSPEALSIAAENANTLGVSNRLQFIQSNWFEQIEGQFDLIISNPPYIKRAENLPPEVKNFDPHLALFGGEDGLNSYRAIASGAAARLAQGGLIVVEIGHDQAAKVVEISKLCDLMLFDRVADLGGRDRGLAFRRP
ncbi:peptide chain release factor N(5)-glutamine methyltransferase [Aestuariivirga litoralis]|uniref:peptide chain release factor N(5)-glutamine methyltransferase n=1 Tax=Aestuariivirga litoralis TaxID=2650924 RepID=UPI0018C65E0E|nr:peptide chain release factor N(5)-glutamine methyltransferase [Aestuariivirga litoralis]